VVSEATRYVSYCAKIEAIAPSPARPGLMLSARGLCCDDRSPEETGSWENKAPDGL